MKPIKPFKRSLLQTAVIAIPFWLGGAYGFGECCALTAVGFALNFLLYYAIYYAERNS